jgi:hypothetical protein
MKPAIVVVAYNRPKSLENLLNSISKANYGEENISLVISIDYTQESIHDEVVKIAQEFSWKFGPKKIIKHKTNLGLREHILSCGDMSVKYGSIILLEDDLRVSNGFYKYASKASSFYKDEINVAGISLYAYEFEELGWYRFYPKKIGGDTFFMQWAASWGQLWTQKQWVNFRDWYKDHKNIDTINIPDEVKLWKKSWKKFFIAYLVDQEKFFAYPYNSHTTVRNSLLEETGIHNTTESRSNNVQLVEDVIEKNLVFSDFHHDTLKYDVFFQPLNQKIFIADLNKVVEVEFDFFGTKKEHNIRAPFLCSTKNTKDSIQSFSNKLIPYEDNILWQVAGNEFQLSLRENFSYKDSILTKGKRLFNARKIYWMIELIFVLIYRIRLYLK